MAGLASMELTPDEREQEKKGNEPASYTPRYAGGLCLYLDEEALSRLGLKEPLAVGTTVSVMAEGRVIGRSEDEHEMDDGPHRHARMSVQITAMDLRPEKAESDPRKLYPKSKMEK